MNDRRVIRAALIDIGGTLVPDDRAPSGESSRRRVEWLAGPLPELDEAGREALLRALQEDARTAERDNEQVTDARIAARLAELAPVFGGRAAAVREVMGRYPDRGVPERFSGAEDLLREAARLGLRRVLVSNVAWSSADDVRERWPGHAELFEAVVTSYDVGRRKPHPAMFQAALRAARRTPEECVFIGDSERNDIEPAVALGMTAIRVAIQGPAPERTAAHRVVTSLVRAKLALRALAALTDV